MYSLDQTFGTSKPVIGMVHLRTTPGFSGHSTMDETIEAALRDARTMEEEGIDGILLENSFNLPFDKVIRPETTAAMAICTHEVVRAVDIPVGVVVIMEPNDRSAMAIAKCAGADFIRACSYNEAVLLPFGIFEGRPAELIQYQKSIEANEIRVYGDIQIKSGTMLAPRTLAQSARGATMGAADAIVVTGTQTGVAPLEESLREVTEKVSLPVLAGSGATADNVSDLFGYVDGCIVGSELKTEGFTSAIDPAKVNRFMEAANRAR